LHAFYTGIFDAVNLPFASGWIYPLMRYMRDQQTQQVYTNMPSLAEIGRRNSHFGDTTNNCI